MSLQSPPVSMPGARRALALSTAAFIACFAVWTIFSILGLRIRAELGLSDTAFGLLVGAPVLSGALSRLPIGIFADRYGGRAVYALLMVVAASATWLLSFATTYGMYLAAALGLGLAGGAFAAGVAYVSRWYPPVRQGAALGIFGMGNVGATLTHVLAPLVLATFGWRGMAQIWAAALAVTAVVFWAMTREDPVTRARRGVGQAPPRMLAQLAPIRRLQVWRFSLYYFFTFGAFVGLSLWLPRYYMGVYGLELTQAGLLGAAFSLPGSVFRVFGGFLSDRHGARRVMYWTFIASVAVTFLLSYPPTDYVVHGVKGDIRFSLVTGLAPFALLTSVLGFFMALGSAAVYKHIPVYYPDNVGAVGGLVGMIGALGGFVLPLAFGVMSDVLNVWTSCFMLLFALVATALTWMHFAIQRLERARIPALRGPKFLPELGEPAPAFQSAAPPHAAAMPPQPAQGNP